MARVGVLARRVHDRLVGTGGSRLRRPRWARGGVGLESAVVVGGGGAVARSTAWPTRIGRVRARIVRW
jgi:hypothetical protein